MTSVDVWRRGLRAVLQFTGSVTPPDVHLTSLYVGVFTTPSITLAVIEGLGTRLCKLASLFAVKVSRPYFSTSPQGTCAKFGLGTLRLAQLHDPTFVGRISHMTN